jgi:hypothetical protein
MWPHVILPAVTIGAMLAADSAAGQGHRPGESGTAVVRVAILSDGAAGSFRFKGTPAGLSTPGGSLLATALRPGRYVSTLVDTGPELRLVAITCNDQSSVEPSEGDVSARTGTFNVDAGEIVTCVFTLESVAAAREPFQGAGGVTGTNPFRTPGSLDGFPVPDDVPPGAGSFQLPRTGPWKATNDAGQMVCSGYTVPLPSFSEAGTLEVLADARTVRGTGFGQVAPFTMNPEPAVTGR